ncbi:hypothetical protein ACFQDN_21950 [Pseudomonas asuensis]|uniref:Uncharacterized protein n=1 Tax=Pseudomonas asuensis TaxID=1825787 RepID=A0ABQ2H2H8_9PSED|nr:hypothetical protein GCM10009425_40340 [Pseudomonas asuensis]
MIIGQQQPLEIAAKQLKASTLRAVRKSPSFNHHGWKILDRWAFNSPEQLRKLEQEGEVILLGRLLEQQMLEQQILNETIQLRRQGMTEHEILAINEVNTEL